VYIPTFFENYVLDVELDGKLVELALWDPIGQDEADNRLALPLSYPDTHVFLVVFAVDSPPSLASVETKVLKFKIILRICLPFPDRISFPSVY
jgi:GTPase SAR1 family protein